VGLTGWQISRVRAFIDKNLHRTIHTQDLSAVARRSPAHFSRSFKLTFGEPPHAYVVKRRLEKACHLMVTSSALAERNSSKRGVFGSGASLQVVQASLWPKPGQLAARTGDAIRRIKPREPAPIGNIPWATRAGKF
jgi:AraC-like DNA-binding protein